MAATPVVHAGEARSPIQLLRTPDAGLQPQAVADAAGTVHLIFYRGPSLGGDLFYARREPGGDSFAKAIPVNSRPKSAIAAGTIRGAQLALGRNGRVHVAWNGPAPRKGAWMEAPMLYTRLNDAGTAFEPERDLIVAARGLDGGGSVAADPSGNVYVFWHAPRPGNTNGEAGRAVFVARSTDDGRTFAPEKPATLAETGACGCCGMKAFADGAGNVVAVYRTASEKVNRDEALLLSRDRGQTFDLVYSHPWKVAACPMSSAFISSTGKSLVAAWETDGQVFLARVDPMARSVSSPSAPPGRARRKHPVAVANSQGEILLVWTEAASRPSERAVAWQRYSPAGDPIDDGRAEGLPLNSLATAFATPSGGFAIVY